MGESTTADEFAAELEGALHIKEQEAIIAEVHCVCARARNMRLL
jgi:hypothetical protein